MAGANQILELRPKKTKKHVPTPLGAACVTLFVHTQRANEKVSKVNSEAVERPSTPEGNDDIEASTITPPAAPRKLSASKKHKIPTRRYQSRPILPLSIRHAVEIMPRPMAAVYQAHIKFLDGLRRKSRPKLAELIVCHRRRQLLADGLNEFLVDCLKASTLPTGEGNRFANLVVLVQEALDDMEAYMVRGY